MTNGNSPVAQMYMVAWVPRKDGWIGARHILPEGSKTAICGTKARGWHYGVCGLPLERIYQSNERRLGTIHKLSGANAPCRRCMTAVQKLRDPLDRLSDINPEK